MARHLDAIVGFSLLVTLVAACGGEATPPTTATPSLATTTPSPVPPTGRTPVYGSTECTRTELSDETRGDLLFVYERYRCFEEMSDPRVSGRAEYDMETVFLAQLDTPAAPWTAELVLSNEGGTWSGTCTGALDYTTDPAGLPMNYGICTLSGEDGYAGLSYVVMGYGGNEGLVEAGWIDEAP